MVRSAVSEAGVPLSFGKPYKSTRSIIGNSAEQLPLISESYSAACAGQDSAACSSSSRHESGSLDPQGQPHGLCPPARATAAAARLEPSTRKHSQRERIPLAERTKGASIFYAGVCGGDSIQKGVCSSDCSGQVRLHLLCRCVQQRVSWMRGLRLYYVQVCAVIFVWLRGSTSMQV